MDNSLLAVRDINHKYIVVDRRRGRKINDFESYKDLKNNEAVISMLDTVFSRKKDKEHILSVIAKNDW